MLYSNAKSSIAKFIIKNINKKHFLYDDIVHVLHVRA